ncbi:CADM3 protein, partial [Rhadina sibilatrix]|nr:CADM3 protein [Rhadina sibilatrix]
GTEVVEDPNGKTFTVTSRVEFRVTKEDNEVEVTCTVDHESLQNSERSTTQKLQVHCTFFGGLGGDVFGGARSTPMVLGTPMVLTSPCPVPSPQEFLWEKEGSDAPLQLSSESVLIFPLLNKSDSGTYVCTATSSMGSVVAKYNLDVSDLPQLPTPHVHSTPAPPPGPSQPISHAPPMAPSFTPALIQAKPLGSLQAAQPPPAGVAGSPPVTPSPVSAPCPALPAGTYLTHEAKGSDDAPDADTAIINAEG